jgi:hypothetical protein
VAGSPLASHVAKVADDARAALVSEVGDALRSYLAAGALTFPIEAHLANAKKEPSCYPISASRWPRSLHRLAIARQRDRRLTAEVRATRSASHNCRNASGARTRTARSRTGTILVSSSPPLRRGPGTRVPNVQGHPCALRRLPLPLLFRGAPLHLLRGDVLDPR